MPGAGCGGASDAAAPAGPSAAADQSSDSSRSTPGAAVQTAQTDRITDQFALEKNVSGVWGKDAGQYISVHVSVPVPQLECDSPDTAYINDELNDIYAAHFREYEAYEEAGQPGGEYPQIGVNWDAYWYGDCVSLVVSSYYGGTDPIYSQGWCFDFAAGHKLSVTELLMRRGLDPDETQLAVYRADIQTFDRNMVQQEYYDSLRENGMLSEMRADTLRDNGLENLTVLLKNENTVTLVAGCHTTAGSG